MADLWEDRPRPPRCSTAKLRRPIPAHLAATDTAAIDAGIDLSSNDTFPFDYDIDDQRRVPPWEIGADEVTGLE